MQVTVTFPADQISEHVKFVFKKQIPFATSLALNHTAKDVQAAQRKRMAEVFTLRRTLWAERSIKITKFSSKTDLAYSIAIDPPGGRGDIFGKFETETRKVAKSGTMAVPIRARFRKTGIIRDRDRPRQMVESGRAFVRRVGGKAAIFERLRPGVAKRVGQALKLLYILVPSVPIKPNLEYVKTAEKTVSEVWARNFVAAFDRAIRTAR